MKFKLSLKLKLISVTIFMFTVLVTVVLIKDYNISKNQIISFQEQKVVAFSDSIKNGIMTLMLEKRAYQLQDFIKGVCEGHHINELRIFLPSNGKIVASSERSEVGTKIYKEDVDIFLNQKNPEPFTINKKGVLYMSRILPIKNVPICYKCHPKDAYILGVLDIEFSLTEMFEVIDKTFINHILFFLLSIGLFSLVFLLIVTKLVDEPLKNIMKVMKSVENGDYEGKVQVKSNDIIGELSEKFNNMTAKINDSKIEVEKCNRECIQRASQLASLGEIASGIAHEIKNPLACISSALQVIMNKDVYGKAENKEIIEKVLEQVKKLDKTVVRILEFAKPIKAEKSYVNVNDIIKETLFFVNQLAGKKKVAVDISYGKEIKKVYADPKLLQQVFLNICLNGVESMNNGGTLNVAADLKLIDTSCGKKEYVEVAIKDSGEGIDAESLSKIFDPFFTTKEKGTGLGLAISKQIVEEHYGKIEVESAKGEGTTFRIYLPVDDVSNIFPNISGCSWEI